MGSEIEEVIYNYYTLCSSLESVVVKIVECFGEKIPVEERSDSIKDVLESCEDLKKDVKRKNKGCLETGLKDIYAKVLIYSTNLNPKYGMYKDKIKQIIFNWRHEDLPENYKELADDKITRKKANQAIKSAIKTYDEATSDKKKSKSHNLFKR